MRRCRFCKAPTPAGHGVYCSRCVDAMDRNPKAFEQFRRTGLVPDGPGLVARKCKQCSGKFSQPASEHAIQFCSDDCRLEMSRVKRVKHNRDYYRRTRGEQHEGERSASS